MAQLKASLDIVEEWKKKCFALSDKSDDVLVSMTTRLLENLSMTLMGSARSRIKLALNTLNYERSNGMSTENKDMPLHRTLLYCVIESVNGALFDLTAMKECSTSSIETQTEEILDHQLSLVEPKEEPMDDSRTIPYANQTSLHDFMGDEMESKEEELEDMDNGSENDAILAPENNHMKTSKEKVNGTERAKIAAKRGRDSMTRKSVAGESALTKKCSSNDIDFMERKRRARSVPRLIGSHEDSDELAGPSMKKSRAKSVMRNEQPNKSESNKMRVTKSSDTEMLCHKCEYHTRSVTAWIQHLRLLHGTSPTQAGLALRCQCGHESYGSAHSFVCAIANFTVIHKRDEDIVKRWKREGTVIDKGNETIRKSGESRINGTELECPENDCEYRTRSAVSWLHHFSRKHSTTVALAGVALLCECGREVASNHHIRSCEMANFTVVRKKDEPIPSTKDQKSNPRQLTLQKKHDEE